MTETKLVLTVQHKKPLPKDAAKVIEQRFYMWAYSQGVEVGVTASVESEKEIEPEESRG